MRVRHQDPELQRVEADPEYNGRFDAAIARGFRKVMNLMRNVANETELYDFKSLHFEKLKGKRQRQCSLRINSQWRLIVEIERHPGKNNNLMIVIEIEDYH